jgi:hypothetical protein
MNLPVPCPDCRRVINAHVMEFAHLYPDALLILAEMILDEHRRDFFHEPR